VTASTGPAADAAREAFRERSEAKGHAVENARAAVAGLEAAFASGALQRTPALASMLDDLSLAVDQDEGQRLGGKSAEAARFILRAIGRELDNA
jgi:secreted protein with Ig-like and vWFA domain